jgi:hypothetical protein
MRRIAAFAVILALPFAGFASGTKEKKTETGRPIALYMLARSESEAEVFAIERMDLPAALSLFDWTGFTWDGKEVSMRSSSGYGMNRRKVSSVIVGRLTLLEYRIDLAGRQQAQAGAKTSVDVSFTAEDCRARDGSVLYQPERLAVILAVKAKGIKTGYARIKEISHQGGGEFSATVELR